MVIGERSWDVELLNDMFEERDINLIRSIQLSQTRDIDGWCWNMEPSGFYSVKSAYKVLQASKGNWLFLQDDTCWKNLSKLPIPPKVHHFLWKACSGCLPTKVQLQSKHVNVDLLCPFCNMHVETIFHVLLDCSVKLPPAAGVEIDFGSWVCALFDGCREEVVTFQAVVVGVNQMLLRSRWGCVTPEIAEVIGIKEALSWIKRKGWEKVVVESDALVVVQAINSSIQMPSQFGLLVEDCCTYNELNAPSFLCDIVKAEAY
ncbi:uncharacterized protein LOC133039780 [Cannabis sativa]|uniref:uncharacterized protein LOC133039780 n=1 Tax=Cannabis sativa TaxID=3483 RepID=UPI0029CA9009|nr:uncharacterized protein LOC133039780 [Cannabis sativa]